MGHPGHSLYHPWEPRGFQGPEPLLCWSRSREPASPGGWRHGATSLRLSFLGTEVLQEQPDFGGFHLLFIYFLVVPLLLHMKGMALERDSRLQANAV